MAFPLTRMRRLRRTPALRELVRETRLNAGDLVLPIFVEAGLDTPQPIEAMPGVSRQPVSGALSEAAECLALGIPAMLFFGIPAQKDAEGSGAWDPEGGVQLAISAIKAAHPDLVLIADCCLCEYTDHGHCGPLNGSREVDNDAALELLARTAVSQAAAGADVIAPSDMMDGRVGFIRAALDEAGYEEVAILAYSAKFASAFYGPFREAAESAPQFGDRRSYQMDAPNAREALREVALDIQEGADIVMVKPALAYLDIIYRVKTEFGYPTAAYAVSGEYSMIKAAAQNGWLDENAVMLESLTAIKRAGADLILTYFAKQAAALLK